MTALPAELSDDLAALLGDLDVPMSEVEARIQQVFGPGAIVWEGDAATFQYGYVSESAVAALGYPTERWLREQAFWADVVVHEYDREDAVSYCALATARKQHHVFDYRALSAAGELVWFRDYVKVLLGPRGLPVRLRGFMLDVSSHYANVTTCEGLRAPRRDVLDALSA